MPQHLMGTDAFQEVDVLGMTMPVVKHSALVRDPLDLYRIAREAMQIARSGRPGPVLLDLPKDVTLTAVVPVGYPKGKFGPVTRAPAESFVSWDRYAS